MEGSSPQRPANYGALDPSVVNGSGPGPMAQVPVGGGPGGAPPQGGGAAPAPGPAAFSMPTPQQPAQAPQQPVQQPIQQPYNPMPPGVAELNAPGESILLTEMQELKDAFHHVRKITLLQGLALFCISLAVIFYLTSTIQNKISPEVE